MSKDVMICRHARVRRGFHTVLIPSREVTYDDVRSLSFAWEDPMHAEPPDSGHLDLRPFSERGTARP